MRDYSTIALLSTPGRHSHSLVQILATCHADGRVYSLLEGLCFHSLRKQKRGLTMACLAASCGCTQYATTSCKREGEKSTCRVKSRAMEVIANLNEQSSNFQVYNFYNNSYRIEIRTCMIDLPYHDVQDILALFKQSTATVLAPRDGQLQATGTASYGFPQPSVVPYLNVNPVAPDYRRVRTL